MKIKNILIIALLSIVSVVNAQNDTLYLYKNGSATLVSAVSGIDSMVVRKTKVNLTIGQNYQGGKVAYLFKPTDAGYKEEETRGLILGDILPTKKWSNNSNILISTKHDLGAGSTNTSAIIQKQGAGDYAAISNYNLISNGYDDWFLPSYQEITSCDIFANKSKFSISQQDISKLWTSSEINIDYANAYSLATGNINQLTKESSCNSISMRYITSDTSTLNRTNTLYFYRKGEVVQGIETIQIDSLSFKKPLNQLLVGQYYKGGYISYIYQQGDSGYVAGETHGIIISSNDINNAIKWGPWNVETKAYSKNGKSNTELIVSILGTGDYAAYYCYNLDLNGYSDWYLPSYEELLNINKNRFIININSTVWSSSEAQTGLAWDSKSVNEPSLKGNNRAVRAIRYF